MKKVFEKVPIKKIVFPAPQYFTQIYTANELLKDPVFYPMSDPLDNQKFLYFVFGHPKFLAIFQIGSFPLNILIIVAIFSLPDQGLQGPPWEEVSRMIHRKKNDVLSVRNIVRITKTN